METLLMIILLMYVYLWKWMKNGADCLTVILTNRQVTLCTVLSERMSWILKVPEIA